MISINTSIHDLGMETADGFGFFGALDRDMWVGEADFAVVVDRLDKPERF